MLVFQGFEKKVVYLFWKLYASRRTLQQYKPRPSRCANGNSNFVKIPRETLFLYFSTPCRSEVCFRLAYHRKSDVIVYSHYEHIIIESLEVCERHENDV